MTNETKSRIHAYTEALPHMKEKVFAALLMLVVAACIVVTATYAWITLSRAPEVSNITTTLSANGALEIALAKPDGSQPDEFDIDENADIGTNLTESNLQWGNLVNLSDKSYGIDNVALRPAQLRKESLATNPLWGAIYGEDGRITALEYEDFAYTKFNGTQFLTSSDFGVRAIATYKTEISTETQGAYDALEKAVETAHNEVNTTYEYVAPLFSKLGEVVNVYANDRLNETNSDLGGYIEDVIPLYKAVLAAMEKQKTAYVALANLQNYLISNEADIAYEALTWDDLVANRSGYSTDTVVERSEGDPLVISLVGLSKFIEDYILIQDDIKYLEQYAEDVAYNGAAYYWDGTYTDANGNAANDNSVDEFALNEIVADLVDYGSMRIDLSKEGKYENSVLVVGLSPNDATSLMGANGQSRMVFIVSGILQRLEKIAVDPDFRINGKAEIQLNVIVSIYGKATCYFAGEEKYYSAFSKNILETTGVTLAPNDAVAEDTYALAFDLWVRSNAEQTCLILEGAIVSDPVKGDFQYQGDNRIWGEIDGVSLTSNSTTQGGGSCYTYYADTPEDMMRSLELLKTMKVVFAENYLDDKGNVIKSNPLATAEMDTENYLAVNGCITVPLVLSSDATTSYTYVDDMNAVRTGRAIADLYADDPVCITAIVYLDGSQLSNDDVLAAAQIDGSLNIQFGSSADLDTMGDSELKDDYRYVTATVSPDWLDYDEAKVEIDLTTTVTVQIKDEGRDEVPEPTAVTAFFVRAINATQGSREEPMEFHALPDGTWVSTYEFTAPGTYYLHQVCVDGVNYTLEVPQKVEVYGYGQNNNVSVIWSESSTNMTIRTSDDSHTTKVTAKFSDVKKTPASVQARFVRDDGNTVSVPLTKNSNGDWVGATTFTVSGVYQLQYLVADGHYIDIALDDGSYRTLDLSLGMYVTVENKSGALREDFTEGETYPREVKVKIFNNAGAELIPQTEQEKQEKATLYYSNGGSLTNTVDAELVWDEQVSAYTGTMFIRVAGQFQFAYVTLGSNRLSEYREDPPVYVLRSDKPVIYNTDSACASYEETGGIQYAPVTKDAIIDGIRIKNATSGVSGKVVVYSEEANEFFTVDLEYNGSYSEDDKVAGGEFYVKLPSYNGEQTGTNSEGKPIYKQLQDGTWTVAAISLWNCFDEDGVERGADDPLIWVDNGTLGEQYLSTPKAPAAPERRHRHGFSALTTTVSAEIKITMDPGTTALGSHDTPFGTIFHIADIGMSVTVLDGNNKPIPKGFDITMTVSYSGNENVKNEDGTVRTDNAKTYGYEVDTDASTTYTIKLDVLDEENVTYTVAAVDQLDAGDYWKYVGVYKVESLVVNLKVGEDGEGNAIYEAYEGTIPGVPAQYTVTTKAAEADSIKVIKDTEENTNNASLGNTVFGLDTGLFLDKYNLNNTFVTVSVVSSVNEDVSMEHAVIGNLKIEMILKYLGGSEEKGGYTIDGETGYEMLTLSMVKSGTAYVGPTGQTMLAGEYEPMQLNVTLGGTTEIWEKSDFKELFDETERDKVFEVYSKKPDVKITGVSPTTKVKVNTNDKPDTNYKAAEEYFEAKNRYDAPESETDTDYGRWAVVYMQYAQGAPEWTHSYADCEDADKGANYANYTAPKVSFQLSDAGSADAVMNLEGDSEHEVKFVFNTYTNEDGEIVTEVNAVEQVEIGKISVDTNTGSTGALWWACSYTETTETATLLGTVIVEEITSIVGDATVTRQLANPITISQPNQEHPTLTWDTTGVTIAVTHGNTTYNGTDDIPAMAALTATVTAEFGYHHPVLEKPDGAIDWEKVSGDEYTAVYSFTMPFESTTLKGRAEKYPEITFSEPTGVTVTVDVKVGDDIVKSDVASSTGIKDGTTVVVTLTAVRAEHICWPRLDLSQCTGVTEWTAESGNGDFEYKYEFTMPGEPVKLVATTTPMNSIKWTNSDKLNFSVVDQSDPDNPLSSGDYVVPEHVLTIKVDALGEGSINPTLTSPDKVDLVEPGLYSATYEYEMPYTSVELIGSVTGYPSLIVGKQGTEYIGVEIEVKNDEKTDESHKTNDTGSVSIKPGNPVTITLTAAEGYFNPRMTKPEGVDDWQEVNPENWGYWSATYSFTMPNAEVNAKGCASATPMPTVILEESDAATLVITKYTGYNGSELVEYSGEYGSGVAVAPDTTVTVKATEKTSYHNPTASSEDVDLGDPEKANEIDVVVKGGTAKVYSSITYTFKMIEETVTLKAAATANPTITYSRGSNGNSNIYAGKLTLEVDVDEEKVADKWTNHGNTVQVRPGLLVKYTVDHDNDKAEKTTITYDVGGAFSDYDGDIYSGKFNMPGQNLTFTIDSESPSVCVTPETLITLADGTQTMIKDLKGDEMLLVWNHYTGKLDVAPVLAITDHYGVIEEVPVIVLQFSDGSYVEIIGEHVFFDYDLNRYAAITSENVRDYVGDEFAKLADSGSSLDRVELVGYTEEVRKTGVYEVNTAEHFVCFTNGLLSAAAFDDLFLNCYDFTGENLVYSEELMKADIEKYGLYTYDDFAEYLSEELFDVFDLGKLKISVGKGYTTWDRIVEICHIVMNANVDMNP